MAGARSGVGSADGIRGSRRCPCSRQREGWAHSAPACKTPPKTSILYFELRARTAAHRYFGATPRCGGIGRRSHWIISGYSQEKTHSLKSSQTVNQNVRTHAPISGCSGQLTKSGKRHNAAALRQVHRLFPRQHRSPGKIRSRPRRPARSGHELLGWRPVGAD